MTEQTGRWGGRRGQHARPEHDIKELGEKDFCIVRSNDPVAGMFEAMADFFAKKGKPKLKDK
jgi:hypothetical protein